MAERVLLTEPSQPSTNHLNPSSRREHTSTLLPVSATETKGFVPINKDGKRIDIFLPKPTPEARELYQKRVKEHKLCNEFHLGGKCQNVNCAFDHNSLEPEAMHVMKYILKEYPCPRKGKCRLAKCYYGHICQKDGCRGDKPCKFNPYMHDIDPRVHEWLLLDNHPKTEDHSISDDFPEEDSIYGTPNAPGGVLT
jgi:hypothetical protein